MAHTWAKDYGIRWNDMSYLGQASDLMFSAWNTTQMLKPFAVHFGTLPITAQ